MGEAAPVDVASPPPEVQSIGEWRDNADLIVDVARLGWLSDELTILDASYGHGNFWTRWRPRNLIGVDLNPTKSEAGPVDFRDLPYPDRYFDVVVLDPPYKLSGTPALGDFDERYGIEAPTTFAERMSLIAEGTWECARVARKHLLVKVQDQVVGARMRWQTDVVTEVAARAGFRKADRFEFQGGSIPQPGDRRQLHARHAGVSQLLVFTRGRQNNGVDLDAICTPKERS